MRIVIIADTFPPLRSSGAVQLKHLATQFTNQGHSITMLIASPEAIIDWSIEELDGIRVVRLKSPKTKDINYFLRTFGEFFMPYIMARNFNKSPVSNETWDGIVWYSPSIFFGPLVRKIKQLNKCNTYLIIRDIFPEWAVDMGLMGKGLPYKFFRSIARNQYSVANTIGVQTIGNLKYFDDQSILKSDQNVEVLHNWLLREANVGCSIRISDTHIHGRKIFVYAGNMGVAQGMDLIFKLVEQLKDSKNIGFLFVGRGSEVQTLRSRVSILGLNNCIFFDEIDPTEIPGLYSQCHVGLVSLDARHKTHNIPGKFVSYMTYGLPVLANINAGNDLVDLIKREGVGKVCTDSSIESLSNMAIELAEEITLDNEVGQRCKNLAIKMFSPQVAVKKIVSALQA